MGALSRCVHAPGIAPLYWKAEADCAMTTPTCTDSPIQQTASKQHVQSIDRKERAGELAGTQVVKPPVLANAHRAGQANAHTAGQANAHRAGQANAHSAGQANAHSAGQANAHNAGQANAHNLIGSDQSPTPGSTSEQAQVYALHPCNEITSSLGPSHG